MKSNQITGTGVIGQQIDLTVQELVVLADIRNELLMPLMSINNAGTKTIEIPIELADNLIIFLDKIVRDTKGLEETRNELFNPDIVV